MSKVRYWIDAEDADRELARLQDGFDATTNLRYEAVLGALFAATQAQVHIVTGSLKLSGKVRSEARKHSWRGEIIYGGRSSGPNNPVRYAPMERARGGEHDFLAPADDVDRDYTRAILAWLDDHARHSRGRGGRHT